MAAVGPMLVAAAALQAQREEEEGMAPYSPKDLAEGWEFKILRSAQKFRDPVYLKQVLDGEARAGWVFLEKFDDSRVRLKRPASARERDAALGFDPYRTWVGTNQLVAGLVVAGSIFFVIALAAAALVIILAH